MDALTAALVAAAIAAGLAGTWSPCGFSMIETIGPVGHTGGRATTLAACLTFSLGALAGGVLTFGALSLLGEALHGAGERLAQLAAAAIALAAAIAELRGARIVPQVRRQVPEHWRRLMPMPLAAGLYGVLLGLGFTTFVLSFGVFALAGIAVALGEPATGVAIGLAFGIARALPVALTAPFADRPAGIRVTELMAGRPAILRGMRAAAGVALLAAAAASALPANAARTEGTPAADPAVSGEILVMQRPDRSGLMRRRGRISPLPGSDPAAGDGRIAVRRGGEILVLNADSLELVRSFPAPEADAIAVSSNWLAWRSRHNGRDSIFARRISGSSGPGEVKAAGRAGRKAQLGRPSLDGNRLVYARATQRRNVIVKRLLGKGRKGASHTVMRSRTDGLSSPSIRGGRLLYVRHTERGDRLKLASLGGGEGRTLLSTRSGTLWSTALGARRAYVTQLHGSKPRQRVLSAKR